MPHSWCVLEGRVARRLARYCNSRCTALALQSRERASLRCSFSYTRVVFGVPQQLRVRARIDPSVSFCFFFFLFAPKSWAAEQRNATTGAIYGDPTRFPSGMRALADKLHAQNFTFGLYTARNTRTCSKGMPGSLGNERLDAATFAEMGADFLKNDVRALRA